MVKEIELNVPQSWEDISLKKYLDLQKELTNYTDDEEAQTAIMLTMLCDLDPKYLTKLSTKDYAGLKGILGNFVGNIEHPLSRFILIDGVEYGFEPNLSEMSYGAYVDITQYNEIAINDNWAKIMNILYRPITEKRMGNYSIQPYTGDQYWEKWLEVGMDKHFGALFFLLNLSTDLVKSTLKSLKGMDTTQSYKQILERSGEIILPYMNWPKEILAGTMK